MDEYKGNLISTLQEICQIVMDGYRQHSEAKKAEEKITQPPKNNLKKDLQ